jgi:uncharacterized protein YpbB
MDPARREQIREACTRFGMEWLRPIKDALPDDISHDEIRLVVAAMKRERKSASSRARKA